MYKPLDNKLFTSFTPIPHQSLHLILPPHSLPSRLPSLPLPLHISTPTSTFSTAYHHHIHLLSTLTRRLCFQFSRRFNTSSLVVDYRFACDYSPDITPERSTSGDGLQRQWYHACNYPPCELVCIVQYLRMSGCYYKIIMLNSLNSD